MSSVGSVVYAPLVKTLISQGYGADSLHVINNTSVVEDLTNTPNFGGNALKSDTEQIRDVLRKLITDQQRDVLIVAHSYGGTPAIYASSGLWKHQRSTAGQAGGVIKIALMSSSLTLPGNSVGGERAEWQKANNQPGDEGAKVEVVDGVRPLVLERNGITDTRTGSVPHSDRHGACLDERHYRRSHPQLTASSGVELSHVADAHRSRWPRELATGLSDAHWP